MTVGVALPTGAVEIAGRGVQPYLQLPWSWKLHDGWGLSGTFTEFFPPADFTGKRISETTFVVEKTLTEKISVFTEYIGDYPEGGSPSQLLNSGGLFHLTHNQQLDFTLQLGLTTMHRATLWGWAIRFELTGSFGRKSC